MLIKRRLFEMAISRKIYEDSLFNLEFWLKMFKELLEMYPSLEQQGYISLPILSIPCSDYYFINTLLQNMYKNISRLDCSVMHGKSIVLRHVDLESIEYLKSCCLKIVNRSNYFVNKLLNFIQNKEFKEDLCFLINKEFDIPDLNSRLYIDKLDVFKLLSNSLVGEFVEFNSDGVIKNIDLNIFISSLNDDVRFDNNERGNSKLYGSFVLNDEYNIYISMSQRVTIKHV